MNKIIFLFALCLFVIKPIAKAQDLRWGGDNEGGAPYVFPDPKNPTNIIGFEVDLMSAIARHFRGKAIFVQNQWDGLIPGLQRGNYDLAVNGIEITDDRKKQINFSIPYYATGEQLTVRKEEQSIKSLADLGNRTVGTLKNSFAQRMLEADPSINVLTYEGQINAYEDLAKDRSVAVLMDWPIAIYYAKPNDKLKLVGNTIGHIEYGICVRKDDSALLNKINGALLALMKSGELKAIYEKWGLWNDETSHLISAQISGVTSEKGGATALSYYTKTVTQKVTWREKLKRYISYLPMLLLKGAPMTLLISILSMAVAVIVGLGVALIKLYAPRPLSWAATAYIEIFRGTPLLIQLYIIFYGLPNIGIKFAPMVAGVLGLGLNYGAYEAENYRAGIQSIPNGQMEASFALGMSRWQSLRYVVLPQAIRVVIPPVTNDFIALLKDSSIVSVITMVELTKIYGQLASTYYDYLGVGLMAAAVYFLIGLPFVKLARYAEKRFNTA